MAHRSQPRVNIAGDPPATTWPQAEESCGEHYLALPGGQNLWFLAGKANEACGTVFQRIQTVVTGLRKDHDQGKAGLSFHMYMMGKAKSSASLLLVVCSTSVEKRKKFMKLIKQNGVLDGLPPIQLGHALSPIALAGAEPRTSNTAQDMPTANTPPTNEWVSIPSSSSEPTTSLSSHLQPSLSPSAGSRIHSNFGRLTFRPISQGKAHASGDDLEENSRSPAPRKAQQESSGSATTSSASLALHQIVGLPSDLASYVKQGHHAPMDSHGLGHSFAPSVYSRSSVANSDVQRLSFYSQGSQSTADTILTQTPSMESMAQSTGENGSQSKRAYSYDSDSSSTDDGSTARDPELWDKTSTIPLSPNSPLAKAVAEDARCLLEYFDNLRYVPQNTGDGAGEGGSRPTEALLQPGSAHPRQRGKRSDRQPDQGEGESSDDEDAAKAPLSKRPRVGDNSVRFFACHLWKRDPEVFSDCFRYQLRRAKDVKQHLLRCHMRSISCGRCQSPFDTHDALEQHEQQPEGCAPRPPDPRAGIPHSKMTEVQSHRAARGSSEGDKWFKIWEILFPHIPRPQSAYIPITLAQELVEFRDFFDRNAVNILYDNLRSEGFSVVNADGSRVDENRTHRTLLVSLDMVYSRWNSSLMHHVTGGAVDGGDQLNGAMQPEAIEPQARDPKSVECVATAPGAAAPVTLAPEAFGQEAIGPGAVGIPSTSVEFHNRPVDLSHSLPNEIPGYQDLRPVEAVEVGSHITDMGYVEDFRGFEYEGDGVDLDSYDILGL